ncbi:MAG: hypothetical protein ABFS12_07985 [Bacteroidota bacterium]
MKNNIFKIFFFVGLSLIISCGSPEQEEPEESILVEIGDVTISVSEFIRRSEYTIRPPYCKSSTNLDKKIVINSLIAEKMFALEATDTNEIVSSNEVQLYLQGLKEQAMRQWLYSKVADEKVEVDSTAILSTVKVAGRKYKLHYFSLPDSNLAQQTSSQLTSGHKSFENVYLELSGLDSIPYREVEWGEAEQNVILDSLYTVPLMKNQVVGPIKTDEGEYLFAKVKGWIDRPIITEQQFNERWKKVGDKYHSRKAQELYNQFILETMAGKKIEFNPDIFFKIANLLGPLYLTTDDEKEDEMNNAVWDIQKKEVNYSDINKEVEELQDDPLFKVNEEVYTVKDFVKEVKIHPLVFRQKKMKNKEFGQQLQFAIMDLIRDKYLTEEAYNKGYDQINVVKRNVNMWKDNISYVYQKEKYLRSVLPDTAESMNYVVVLEKYLNSYVDSLQKKYSDVIYIDVEKFNDVNLTRIDMSAHYNNEAYPRVVPSFPIVTTDNKLEYGNKMEIKNKK